MWVTLVKQFIHCFDEQLLLEKVGPSYRFAFGTSLFHSNLTFSMVTIFYYSSAVLVSFLLFPSTSNGDSHTWVSVTCSPGLSTLSYFSSIVAQPLPSFFCCPRPPSHRPSSLNLGLPRTRPPLASAINTLLAIRYSSILSTCPNHLNTLWSALLANYLSIPALLRTS